MSLRGFHVIFITLATAVSLLFSVWTLTSTSEANAGSVKVLGIASGILGIGLGIYGIWFYRKLKQAPNL